MGMRACAVGGGGVRREPQREGIARDMAVQHARACVGIGIGS